MVNETKVKVGGAWKSLVGAQVKVGGAWKTITTIESKVAGVWKTVLEAVAASPTFVASDSALVNNNQNSPTSWTLTDVAGSGSNRAIVFVCHLEGFREVCHNTCTYNGVSLTRIDVEGTLTNGKEMHISVFPTGACSLSFWLMLNGDIPSAGAYTLTLAYGGATGQNQQGHHAVLMQWDDVDQTNPVGHVQARIASLFAEGGNFSTTQTGNANDGVVLACSASDKVGTYAAGDFVDAGSNMNMVEEVNARNPGGALRVAHDIIPDASEVYNWTVNYGAETTVDALVMASINLQAPGGGDPGLPCSPGCSEIMDQSEENEAPTDAWVGAKWHSNGDISMYEATTQGFGAVSGQTWIGSSSLHGCAATEYDFKWEKILGDTPTVSNITVNTWTKASLGDMEIENSATGSNSSTGNTIQFSLRRRSDNVVILVDRFKLDADTFTDSK